MTEYNTKGDRGGQEASGSEEGFARALIYLRVSTKEQAEMGGEAEGFSIPAQRAACLRKAESLGAVVAEEFVDRGESAKTANRPELARMLEYLRANRTEYVIVHKVDRLARNRADDVVITMAIQKSGATLVSCSENIDETPSGLLLHGIMSSIAEFYSRNLATEVSKGMVQKAMSGGTISMAPVGYLHVRRIVNGREVRTIEVDPERAPHVRWAFEAYATGEWTLHQLTDELVERGLRSRPGPRTTARPMVKSAIHKMLHNPYYVGIVTHRGVAYVGKHPQLVTKALFERVQGMLDAHNHAGERQYVHNHYLKGSIYCGVCGRKLAVSNSRSHTGRIYDYYYCLGRQSDTRSCNWKAVRVSKVEKLVLEHYRSIQLPPQRIAQIRRSLEEALTARRAEAEASEHAVTLRIQRLTDERQKLLHLHYAEAVPVDLFKQEQKRITSELDAARQQLADVSVEFDAIELNLKMALKLARDCYAAYEAADENTRRLFNQAFFEKLYLHVDGEITHDLAEPFGLLLDPDLPAQIAGSYSEGRRSKARKAIGKPGGPRNRIDLKRIAAEGSNVDTVVPPEGFEPSTSRSGGARSNPLSYEGTWERESSTLGRSVGAVSRGPAHGPWPERARGRPADVGLGSSAGLRPCPGPHSLAGTARWRPRLGASLLLPRAMVRMSGERDVVSRDSSDAVGAEMQRHLVVADVDVRMVLHLLRHFGQRVDEVHRADEVVEAEGLGERAAFGSPSFQVCQRRLQLFRCELVHGTSSRLRRPRCATLPETAAGSTTLHSPDTRPITPATGSSSPAKARRWLSVLRTLLEAPLHVAPRVPLGHVGPLVVQLLAAGQSQFDLGAPVLEIHLGGHHRIATLVHPSLQPLDLAAVQQQLADSHGVVVPHVALLVRADMYADQVELAAADLGVAVPQGDAAPAQTLHLRADQRDTGLHGLLDEVVVVCLAI
jgi:site-specific DNA recombinase